MENTPSKTPSLFGKADKLELSNKRREQTVSFNFEKRAIIANSFNLFLCLLAYIWRSYIR